MSEESTLVSHGPCGVCGSSDANALYSDNHSFCFSCNAYSPADGAKGSRSAPSSTTDRGLIPNLNGSIALTKRAISQSTAEHFGYFVSTYNGKPVQVAPYYDSAGLLVAQKVRFPDKQFSFLGKPKEATLFGQHKWKSGGKRVVVTEGEIDCLSVSQVQDNRWPVVSLPNGAAGARKALAKNIEWLSAFEEIVLMFDMDEPGQSAARECVDLFKPGQCKIASLPLKDANEMVQAGRTAELVSAIWNAKVYRPDGIVSVDDVIEQALSPIEHGFSWWMPTLDAVLRGRKRGEVIGIGAGTGVGKTAFVCQQAAHDIQQGHVPALFFLESTPAETLLRVAGNIAGKAFHDPDCAVPIDEKRTALEALRGKLWLYDSWGSADWETIAAKIRYLAVTEGVFLFTVDHLTALADPANERESLETIMKSLASLANELQVVITFVSHLATPEGKSHEEGGRVTIKQFKGSRSIGYWAWTLLALERDQQAEEPEARQTVVRVLKDRKTGRATGMTIPITYDHTSTHLKEAHGFDPEY